MRQPCSRPRTLTLAFATALLAGAASSAAAPLERFEGFSAQPVHIDDVTGEVLEHAPLDAPPSQRVFDNSNFTNPPVTWIGAGAGFRHLMTDVRLNTAPYGGLPITRITRWELGLVRNSTLGNAPAHAQVTLRNPVFVNFSATPMFEANAPILARFNLPVNTPSGFVGIGIWTLRTPAQIPPLSSLIVQVRLMEGLQPPLPPALPVPITNDRVRLAVSNTAANTFSAPPYPTNPAIIGFANAISALDHNNDGVFMGGPTPGSPNENRRIAFNAGTVPATLAIGIYGDPYSSSTCDPTDFNQDGDFPAPLDIEDFLVAVAGTLCATCTSDVDFNNDNDPGTPLDVQAFLSVSSGGPCIR